MKLCRLFGSLAQDKSRVGSTPRCLGHTVAYNSVALGRTLTISGNSGSPRLKLLAKIFNVINRMQTVPNIDKASVNGKRTIKMVDKND